MRLSITPRSTRIGSTSIHDTFRVIELDAGHLATTTKSAHYAADAAHVTGANAPITQSFSQEAIHAIEAQLAIVVPCKDEDVSILDGVLRGIPHGCLIILLSNSRPVNFTEECALLTNYCSVAQRSAIVAHQHDSGFARAFIDAGMPQIVTDSNKTEQIRNGKGEAMIMGVAIAKLMGKQYIGFVDADNLVAGSVHEYCKVYAAGLHYALQCNGPDKQSHAMVRIKWNSKPKVKDGIIVFEKLGRSSRVVNEWMNRLMIAILNGQDGTATIETGNAGEHAMSIEYAMELKFATGYAVEPYQLIDTWERLGASVPFVEPSRFVTRPRLSCAEFTSSGDDDGAEYSSDSSTASDSSSASTDSTPATSRPSSLFLAATSPFSPEQNVRIVQIETRNPHFHDTSKGAGHISKMQVEGLSTIYHSRLTPQKLKDELREYVKENLSGVVGVGNNGELAAPRVYPAVATMEFEVFRKAVREGAKTLKVIADGVPTVL